MTNKREPLDDYTRRVLEARANDITLRNGQGADITPAEARRALLAAGYIEVRQEPDEDADD